MTFTFHVKDTVSLLKQLVEIPSPSGFTKEIMDFMENILKQLQVDYIRTNKGALIATIKGKDETKHRLLTAHTDTLGAMVKEVKGSGRLKLTMVGGFNWNAVEGEYCTIHTADGKKVRGTILMHQTTVHVYKNASSLPRDEQNIEVRIDEKVLTAEDTRKLGVEVGDFVSFDPRFEETEAGFIKSRHLDDKASTALLLQLIKTIQNTNVSLPHTTHFYISNNEEIGYGGNSNVPEETVEYLAVDMGAIGDGQLSDEFTVSICAKDSSGPYHYEFTRQLVELAKKENIDYKLDIYPYYGSDASAAIRAGYDVKHALLGPGIEASHAYERTHIDSLENTAKLLYSYVNTQIY
ncbi:M42 family metallopeptidase [Psychrobacillus psychrodurans]|jgi:putative aminopeptidase FrvX|uniref:M42 family metallopeptidase n=1 Tax=Psychrobacillus TaxID=1221880 RepID=UPI0008EA8550|nr:M42 family metallopeptidase [Psychrobacillus psychrodurans]MCK1996367.1 M42 family metallopeptidase [Psychrobacillus psychrodurans]MCZ8539333.1 M42 family metallopeptidase [Psychrobacillus psychrodurans]SFM36710.1 Putative aminopeptidase FrvX [Psychrobacillus psychrodurans]